MEFKGLKNKKVFLEVKLLVISVLMRENVLNIWFFNRVIEIGKCE